MVSKSVEASTLDAKEWTEYLFKRGHENQKVVQEVDKMFCSPSGTKIMYYKELGCRRT